MASSGCAASDNVPGITGRTGRFDEMSQNPERIRVLAIIFAMVVVTSALRGADTDLRAFVGTWKENQAKTHSSMSGALTYTFAAEADGFVSIVRANTPLRDRARF